MESLEYSMGRNRVAGSPKSRWIILRRGGSTQCQPTDKLLPTAVIITDQGHDHHQHCHYIIIIIIVV